jgi:rhamnosyltransferase
MYAPICAVVVTWNPQGEFGGNLSALAGQVSQIIVVDNASGPEGLARVEQACRAVGARLLRNSDNLGISAGLNRGAACAMELGYAWLALFDQDSCVTRGMLATMQQVLESRPDAARVGVIGSIQVERGVAGHEPESAPASNPAREVRTVITSGSLISLEVWHAVGGFDESLFIDAVDWDYCLKCRGHGFKVLEAEGAKLMHEIGIPSHSQLGQLKFTATNHSPLRYYYLNRNRLVMWRRYWRQEPGWVARDALVMLKQFIKICLAETERSRKVAAIGLGIAHAFHGVKGKARAGLFK